MVPARVRHRLSHGAKISQPFQTAHPNRAKHAKTTPDTHFPILPGNNKFPGERGIKFLLLAKWVLQNYPQKKYLIIDAIHLF